MNDEDLFPILNIPDLPYPDNVVEALKTVNEVLVNSLKDSPIDLNSGYLPFRIDELKWVQFLLSPV